MKISNLLRSTVLAGLSLLALWATDAPAVSQPDFNADGKADILWKNVDGRASIWLMDRYTLTNSPGAEIMPAGFGWYPINGGNFDGTCHTGIVWEHTDGSSALWLMNGTTQVGGGRLFSGGTGWFMKFVGDFNGDGKDDLLWVNTDGRVAMWIMNGSTQVGGASLLPAATGWAPKLVGDFDGDGKADIVWEHTDGRIAIWMMNGTVQVGGGVLLPAATGWHTKFIADFNADGKSDILWEHDDGSSALWIMNGFLQVGGGRLFPGGSGWLSAGVGDINGDGKDDILWKHTDGRIAQWIMNGSVQVGGAVLLPAGSTYDIHAVGSYTGDTFFQWLQQNTVDGSVRFAENPTGVAPEFSTELLSAANVGWTPIDIRMPKRCGAIFTGKTYYLATNGSDSAAGTQAAPWKTFSKAWGVLAAGDRLMVNDGTYTNPSPPANKAGLPDLGLSIRAIQVQAINPGGVTIPPITFTGASYINLVGFRVNGTDAAVVVTSNGTNKASHHLKFQQIGFSCTPNTQNDGACFDMGDGTHHVLLEDSWGWGGGRYTILCYGGPGGNPPNLTCDNNTYRRLVLRQGPTSSSGGNPQASLGLYYASNNTVENVIAIDGNATSDSSNAAFYITGHEPPPDADFNKFYGVIALANKGSGLYLDCPGAICNGAEVRNSVFWASQLVSLAVSASSQSGDACSNAIIDHNTIAFSGNGEPGYDNYACDNATLTNNAIYKNSGVGANQSGSQGSTPTAHHNGYFGNTSGARNNLPVGAGDLTSNPNFLYITRIEAGSPYKNAGTSGDIGANVVNRYQDGVLTTAPLWPWPNEARIRTEMCASSNSPFCASGKTLTRYIWEYLGNTTPPGIYPP